MNHAGKGGNKSRLIMFCDEESDQNHRGTHLLAACLFNSKNISNIKKPQQLKLGLRPKYKCAPSKINDTATKKFCLYLSIKTYLYLGLKKIISAWCALASKISQVWLSQHISPACIYFWLKGAKTHTMSDYKSVVYMSWHVRVWDLSMSSWSTGS